MQVAQLFFLLAGSVAAATEDETSLVQSSMHLSRTALSASQPEPTVVQSDTLGPTLVDILKGQDAGFTDPGQKAGWEQFMKVEKAKLGDTAEDLQAVNDAGTVIDTAKAAYDEAAPPPAAPDAAAPIAAAPELVAEPADVEQARLDQEAIILKTADEIRARNAPGGAADPAAPPAPPVDPEQARLDQEATILTTAAQIHARKAGRKDWEKATDADVVDVPQQLLSIDDQAEDKLDEEADKNEELLDLQSEAKDTQLSKVQEAKDDARLSEFGCLNGGMACDDASAEPNDPFDASSSENIGVRPSGGIDLPVALHSFEKRATAIVEELEKEKPAALAHREAARSEYRSARKANEKDFQDKLFSLDEHFIQTKEGLRKKHMEARLKANGTHNEAWKKKELRQAARKDMTTERESTRAERIQSKEELRAQRRSQQELLDKVYKDSMGSFNLFTRKMMKARFTKNILPKIRSMMQADIQGNLTLLDLGGSTEEEAAADVVNDIGFRSMEDLPSVKFYLEQKTRTNADPALDLHFQEMRTGLFKNLDKMRIQMKKSLTSSVGAIPHVGQTLSAVIPGAVDDVYGALTHAVNSSLINVRNNIQQKVVDAITNPIMDRLTPRLNDKESIKDVELPEVKDLAGQAKESKLVETNSVISNWGVGVAHHRKQSAEDEGEILKEAYSEAKLALAIVRADSELSLEVLDTM